jgi:hypothetical protein
MFKDPDIFSGRECLVKRLIDMIDRLRRKYLTMLVVLVLVLPSTSNGITISRQEQDEIVGKICSLLKSNYISAEAGERVSELLFAAHRDGKYSETRSLPQLAARLDADLKEWSNDKHLSVLYDPDWVRQMRESSEEDAYLTEEMIAEERAKNFGFKRLEVLDGNVGYLDLRIFFHPKYAGATAVAAMNLLADCDAMIIDLRNNGGGWGDMVSFLCSYFLDNEEIVHLNSVYSRPEDRYYQSWTSPYVPGRIMANIPLYILTSKSTFSAAEEFCYDLRYQKRPTIVGEKTRGGAHPISPKVLSDELILIIPELTSIHPVTKSNWEGVGIAPDIEVAAEEALNVAYLSALEKLRASAQSERKRALYQWYVDGSKARLSPVVLDAAILEAYVGRYGTLSMIFENGTLWYQRGDRARYRMIPMSETLFLVDEQGDLRIRFKRENDRTSGLTALYSDGNSTEYAREGE